MLCKKGNGIIGPCFGGVASRDPVANLGEAAIVGTADKAGATCPETIQRKCRLAGINLQSANLRTAQYAKSCRRCDIARRRRRCRYIRDWRCRHR
jgi:uncharacterized protein YjbI with pentapeptide repeats